MSRFKNTFFGLIGLLMVVWVIQQVFSQTGKQADNSLQNITRRRPSQAAVEARRVRGGLPQQRQPSAEEEEKVALLAEPESPTGDPELDLAYYRNEEYRQRYDNYKKNFMAAQSAHAQLPEPPMPPWEIDEIIKKSTVRWTENPFGNQE